MLKFDLQDATFRMHDVLRSYLASQVESPAEVHARLVEAWGDPHSLPGEYAWRWIAYHLDQAEQPDELKRLLLDFDWLEAKLQATEINALIADYAFAEDQPYRQIQRTLTQAAHILSGNKDQLATQLLARLPGNENLETDCLLNSARGQRGAPWLRPLTVNPRLHSQQLIRTLHRKAVDSVAVTPDGRWAVSASDDRTLKVWDLASGRQERTLHGHSGRVRSVAVTPDGRRAVSASHDRTLRVWELASGSRC